MSAPVPAAVRVAVERHALSAFVPALAAALERRPGTKVEVELVGDGARPEGTALDTLLSLEKMLLRRGRPCWSDRISPDALAPRLLAGLGQKPSVLIDLTAGGAEAEGATVLRPLYDGAAGEAALASALFFCGTPEISILLTEPGAEPRIAASGTASLEAAQGIGGAMEAVWSRVAVLIAKALDAPAAGALPETSEPRPIPRAAVLRYGAKALAGAAARSAYRLCCHAPHWRVGWRRAGEGDDVWSRRDLGGARWNVLSDPLDHFYADPFPLFWQGKDWLFFEDLDHRTQKGVISVVAFDDEGRPGQAVPVLEEAWHLSYPFLIEEAGEVWMVPEASLSGEIAIYRAAAFPFRWERHAVLVSGVEAADATIVRHEGRFYMFAVVREGVGGYSDTLAIWHAESLFGPWLPHAQNPVMVDDRAARPAGSFVTRGGALMRPVQDCRAGYGAALGLARVTRLDPEGFSQAIETRIAPDLNWPGRKLHTLNGNGRIEAIDGSALRPKLAAAASLADRFSKT